MDSRGHVLESAAELMISAKISRSETGNSLVRLELLMAEAGRGLRKNPYKQTRKEIAATLKRLIRSAQLSK